MHDVCYESKTNIMRWTKSAMDCYQRGCVCEGCFINEYFCKVSGWTCQMKAAVLASVAKFGIPAHLNRCKDELILED